MSTTVPTVQGVHRISVPTPFPVGAINLYLLTDGESLTLVDTGPQTVEAEQAIDLGLAELGYRVEDLDRIVLTHFHVDHTGLLEKLVGRSGALVYAHPWTERLITIDEAWYREREEFYRGVYRAMGASAEDEEQAVVHLLDYRNYMGQGRVDGVLMEGETVPGLPGWKVVYTPGHALDHISLYRARDGVMVLGDHLIKHISSNAFIEPAPVAGEPRPRTLVLYREALRKVAELEWRIGLPGHGEAIIEYRELIRKRFASQEKRARDVVELVRSGMQTGMEICLALFPRHQDQLMLTMSETLGHLDWLVADGVLRVEEDSAGVWRFQLKG